MTLFFFYGVGPLLVSFLFYCLLLFFPGKSDHFYLLVIFIFLGAPLIAFHKNLKKVASFYKYLLLLLLREIDFKSKKTIFFGGIMICMLSVYSVQALIYPIVDNDNTLYINQAKAFYALKNTECKNKTSVVIINQNDKYACNPSIQPALPIFLAAAFLLEKDTSNYFSFQFLSFYYFILLFSIFLYLIYSISKEENKNPIGAVYYGMIFFVFSWGLTRVLIYNTKESVIYFLGLISLALLLKMLQVKKQERNITLEILLGTVMGLNAFVNFHGVAIEFLMLLIILIFFEASFLERIRKVLLIFSVSFLLGYSQLVFIGKVIFATIVKNSSVFFKEHIDSGYSKSSLPQAVTTLSGDKNLLSNFDTSHKSLYQMSNSRDMYIKGKLQLLTNIGYFGLYFWFFIYTLISRYKKFLANKKLRIVVALIILYYLIIIDPFNLNNLSYAVVLWGSPKYAMFLLLIGLIPLSVYAPSILRSVAKFFERLNPDIFLLLLALLALFPLFLNQISSVLIKILFSTIQIYKDQSFYIDILRNFFLVEFIGAIVFLIIALIMRLKNIKKMEQLVIVTSLLLLIVVPFSVTDVGKVPLSKTFYYLNKNKQTKIENAIYEGDIFKSYFYAKEILPKNSELATDFNEVYAYNDYFSLRENDYKNDARYKIGKDCENWKILYQTNKSKVCVKY